MGLLFFSLLIFRLQNTDLSQSCTPTKEQADMDETKEDPEQHPEVFHTHADNKGQKSGRAREYSINVVFFHFKGNVAASEELAQGDGGEENSGAASSPLSAEMKGEHLHSVPP